MRRVLFPILILIILTGCSISPPAKNPHLSPENLPTSYRIEGIDPVEQGYNACVPTAAEMVFRFYGKNLGKEAIGNWIQGPRGCRLEDLEQFAKSQGFNVHVFYDWYPDKDKIKFYLAEGYPVIVTGQFGFAAEGHMVVVTGYDDLEPVETGSKSKGVFYVADPAFGKIVKLPYQTFTGFHSARGNYGLVIYPKS